MDTDLFMTISASIKNHLNCYVYRTEFQVEYGLCIVTQSCTSAWKILSQYRSLQTTFRGNDLKQNCV